MNSIYQYTKHTTTYNNFRSSSLTISVFINLLLQKAKVQLAARL